MKQMLRTSAACLIVAIACAMTMSAGVAAQTYMTSGGKDRAGTWDFFVPLTYNPSTSWNGPGGSSIDLDDAWGFGFGAGYNFSDRFQLNGIFSWSARDYTANVINSDLTRRDYTDTLYTSTFSVNGIFYFLTGTTTPFLSAGVGYTYFDTNIQTGSGTTTCWWDPWYGNVCGTTAPTRTESDFSYNAGAGIRFDISPGFSLQPSYNKMWVDIRRASGTPDFDVWRLDFIFRM